jgi:phosphodiesterase/alkaline phosphatase D-like protein
MKLLREVFFERQLRWLARAWATGLAALFVAYAIVNGAPQTPEGPGIESMIQFALLGILVVAIAAAWRWEAVGGAVITVCAVALGMMATVAYHPFRSFFVCAAFLIPGLLFLFVSHALASAWRLGAATVGITAALAAGAYGSQSIYNYWYGPTHPESALREQPVDLVEWVWSGGVTPDAAVVTAKVAHDSLNVRLALSTSSDMAGATYTDAVTASTAVNQRVVKFALAGLHQDTAYWYAVEVDGRMERTRQGRLRTFADGPFSFSFAFGSCALVGSNGSVFDTIRATEPLFFFATGDFFYGDITANDRKQYRADFDATLMAPAQAALYQSVPTAYIWDDHDYGANNADAGSVSREAARLTYRQDVPHYLLPAGPGDAPVYQAFTVGRVRFIVTDLRSERSPATMADGPDKSMLGAAQKDWFKQELLAARDTYPVIVWVSSVPWIAAAGAGEDNWGGYATERRELANFIKAKDIGGLVMLSGDAHMLAIDDGTNSDYADGGGAGFPVMQAGALDRRGSVKGGPYSITPIPGGGQFGLMTIEDGGGATVTITWSGRNWTGAELMTYRFTLPAAHGRAVTR